MTCLGDSQDVEPLVVKRANRPRPQGSRMPRRSGVPAAVVDLPPGQGLGGTVGGNLIDPSLKATVNSESRRPVIPALPPSLRCGRVRSCAQRRRGARVLRWRGAGTSALALLCAAPWHVPYAARQTRCCPTRQTGAGRRGRTATEHAMRIPTDAARDRRLCAGAGT